MMGVAPQFHYCVVEAAVSQMLFYIIPNIGKEPHLIDLMSINKIIHVF